MFCHQCGIKLHENDRFCFRCGTPVREAAERTINTKPQDEAAQVETNAILPQDSGAQQEARADQPQDTSAQAETSADLSQDIDAQADANSALPQDTPTQADAYAALPQNNDPQADANSDQSQDTPAQAETNADLPQDTPTQADAYSDLSQDYNPQADANAAPPQDTPPQADAFAAPPQDIDPQASADLIFHDGNVVVSGRKLHLAGKHYVGLPGKEKYKKSKKYSLIPFEAILGTSMVRRKYGGRIFLSLLLLVCFTAGALFSARCGYGTYIERNIPYRDKELAALGDIMELIDNSGADRLLKFQKAQEANRADTDALSTALGELERQQSQEILASVCSSDKFDPDAFFNNSFFSLAYQEYLQDLLNAFKADELLDSWLYSYYKTVRDYGGNSFLDTDLWIYDNAGEYKFSPDLNSASSLMDTQYDLDFYEHVMYTGHIYITASDFMREILSLPRYVVDGAVFVKAYGGAPDTAQMSVPGWSRSHYEEFWLYGTDYYNVDTPIWLDYNLTARNFDLYWNGLVDEAVYYNAYVKFMEKIAPGLPCYDIVTYYADDTAYGGMGFELKGTEASLREIIISYTENHPEFIDELKTSGIYNNKILATSVDEEIAEAKAQLEELENEFQALEEQKKKLEQILADANIYRNNYALLSSDIERHTLRLSYRLLLFGGAAFLCAIAALICLCKFFGFLIRPGRLFVIHLQDRNVAFPARRLSREQLTTLQNRLPGR